MNERKNVVIVVGIPNDITENEIQQVMENCGEIKKLEVYQIENMIQHKGKKDYYIEYQEEEGQFVALKISGTKYKHWRVRTKTREEYIMMKRNEKKEREISQKIDENINSFLDYLQAELSVFTSSLSSSSSSTSSKKATTSTKEEEDMIEVIDSQGNKHCFQKKKKPLPPLPSQCSQEECHQEEQPKQSEQPSETKQKQSKTELFLQSLVEPLDTDFIITIDDYQ